jgi:hypothetical protein
MAFNAFRSLKSTSLRSSCGLCCKRLGGSSYCQGANLLGVAHRSALSASRHRPGLVQSRYPSDRTHWSLSRPAVAGAGAAAPAASAAVPAAEAAVSMMDQEICRLIQQIHDSPAQAVLYATGGGFQVGVQAACMINGAAWPAACGSTT